VVWSASVPLAAWAAAAIVVLYPLPGACAAQWSMGAPRDGGGTGGALRGGAARMRDTVPRAEYVSSAVQEALGQSVTLGRRAPSIP